MKNTFLLHFIFIINLCFSQDYHKYSENEEVFLFGDNVKLRTSPNINSETLKLLPIGTKLKIKKTSTNIYQYNGVTSPWYLVDYNGIEGYIVGGLISLKRHQSYYSSNSFFLYSISKNNEYDSKYINIRLINGYKLSSEIKIKLSGNVDFEILNFDNKGLENVNDIIVIDNKIDDREVDGGKSYIINNQGKLIHMGNTSEIGDGDYYYHKSYFTFPTDEGGKTGVIIYNEETRETKDKNTNWFIKTSQQRDLLWNGTKLIPDNYNSQK